MPLGRSLHIGLNTVNPDAYGGWSGDLAACEFDARDMKSICAAAGLRTRTLLTARATSRAVLGALDRAAAALADGDLFVVTYAGHGGQMPDEDGDEKDRRDETWVLYDRQVLDDELFARWAAFAPGVRIVVVSDSCHSGSVVRAQLGATAGAAGLGADALTSVFAGGRFMPAAVNDRDNADRRSVYDTVRAGTHGADSMPLAARVLLLSGCQDNQTSSDGDQNGLFTGTLRTVWADGAFRGGYRTLLTRIKAQMPPWQTPNYLALNDPKGAFRTERPFAI
ncbi:MAG: caspase family protein [Candidatus Nanopelagicales bacterium]